jgi:hypothetical protein
VAVRATTAPDLDGRLDEDAWANAPASGTFWQQDPDEGEPGTEATEFRVLYTDDALYIGVRAFDSQPDLIEAQLARRDEEPPSDWIILGIDSYQDRRTGFAFFVNPAGVKRDIYLFDDTDDDISWDAVWDVGTSVDTEGWSAEFKIPFSQLRFANADVQEWGFQVIRFINRRNEEQHWRLMPKDEAGLVSKFGDLVGIQGIKPPRRVEVMPYVSSTGAWVPAEDGNPFATGTNRSARVGGDMKIGVTSNLTLSATLNPDFGQVEADPAVVNLSAFETFLLGDGDGANEQLFYTRRIGRAPQASADKRGGYAETIDQTTILGAAKLSGKTANGWTIGLLSALTAEEEADVVDANGDAFQDVVEPRSAYFVGRLGRDFRNGLTQVSLFGTAVNRSLPDNLDWLRSSAYTLGARFNHRFWSDSYNINAWFVRSHVAGSETAIELAQRSSARYYQRPDNDYVTFDPTRTSLNGFAAQFTVGKHAGERVRYATGFDTRSPGFEVNDAGYQREADRTVQFAWVGLRWFQPGRVFRRFGINFNQHSVWSFGWDRLSVGGNVNANWQFLNYWGGNIGISRSLGGLSTGALRGGPAFRTPPNIQGWGGFFSDDRKPFRVGLNGFWFLQPESDSWGYSLNPRVSWRAAANMDFTFGPRLFQQSDSWQYWDQVDALGETRYLFGEIRQTTLATTFRGNVTFTPTLSVQLYAEPFVSTVDYRGFRQVADPRGATFDDRFDNFGPDRLIDDAGELSIDFDADGTPDYGIGNPDFTFLSFRSNVVLRWEYSLGSTLFLVWQHGRVGDNSRSEFQFGEGIRDIFRLDAQNTFVVKVNYWLSL